MIGKFKRLVLLATGSLILSVSAEATAIFAKQYDMKCSGCHVGMPPALNSTGMEFYRKGFKFSDSDKATVDSNVVPLSTFLGIRYKNGEADLKNPKGATMKKEVDAYDPILKIMSAGSINSNISYFVGAKFAYKDPNTDNADDDERSFEIEGRKAYLQYSSNDTSSVTRAGIISPYAQLGNIKRSSEGNPIDTKMFSTPLTIANAGNFIMGADYTYQMKSGLGFLVAAGSVMEDIKYIDSMGDSVSSMVGTNFVAGIDYYKNNFRVAFIANNTEPDNAATDSYTVFLVPIEYSIGNLFLNGAFVYDGDRYADTYTGLEASASYSFMENALVRVTATFDSDDSTTYSFRYSQLFMDSISAGLVASTIDANDITTPANPQAKLQSANVMSAVLEYVY